MVGVPGPWQHRFVGAHGIRFHVAVCEPPPAGRARTVPPPAAPLVLFLHGALQNWYAWRGVLPGVAAAGYRAVAADLRGHGASDATPRGYDLPGLADDVDALVRSLGAQRAVVVGHDLGGWVAWTLAARHPGRLHGLVAVAAPPPRRSTVRGPLLRAVLSAQPPSLPEHVLLHRDGIRRHLDRGRARPAPDPDVDYYVASVRVPSVAHTSLEPWRWLARSAVRPDGVRWWRSVRAPVDLPVLELLGGQDPLLPTPEPDRGRAEDGHRAGRPQAGWTRAVVPEAGHLLPEEAPGQVLEHLLAWLPGVVAAER